MATERFRVRLHVDGWVCSVVETRTGSGYTAIVSREGQPGWSEDCPTAEAALAAADAQVRDLGHKCSPSCSGWAQVINPSNDR